ncbi:MAG: IS91 family transposase [Armatimonadetes bacterium]|nr:IS91 family transposase [Armatimonadota bacterium]
MEIAKIFSENLPEYLQKYETRIPYNHLKTIDAIINCRTSAMGGKVYFCEKCKKYHYSYHSCKNRHCPKCGSDDSGKWLKKQMRKLLPVNYFLVTFTIPEELRFICRSNQKLFYSVLFKASSEALKTLLNDPKYAGGKSGFVGILHTWTRQLHYHPHPHYIVPGGAFDIEKNQWNKANSKFLVPVRALSKIYRAKFRDCLKMKNQKIFNSIPHHIWNSKEFVSNSQAVGKGDKVLEYLSNYVYRVAISNNRIIKYGNGKVTFKYKPSGSNNYKYQTVTALEFMRRFLQHVLPDGFQKIRYYGFLSSAGKNVFDKVQKYFKIKANKIISLQKSKFLRREKDICPHCKSKMRYFASILRKPRAPPNFLLETISKKYQQQTV